MKNTFGNALGLTIFGESHGAAVGAVLDGLAAVLPVDEAYIAERMDRRRARGKVPLAVVGETGFTTFSFRQFYVNSSAL